MIVKPGKISFVCYFENIINGLIEREKVNL